MCSTFGTAVAGSHPDRTRRAPQVRLRDDFRRRKSFIDLSATARFGRSISTTSVAIELDQPLVADPEVMRDLMEHDVPDRAA
jgi:hypothetical protein